MPPLTLPTSAEVRRLAARLVTDELVVVPVRHHSPACALAVERAFERHRPSAVLVEGPRSFTPLVDLLVAPEAEYPLAVYGFARGTAKAGAPVEGRGAYYPFCDYSPELVALRQAVAAGVPASFIDLDVAEQAALDETAAHDSPAGWSLLDERVYEHSAALDRLAAQVGCRDQEDLWELLFEADDDVVDLDEHLARMTAYCLLARHDHTEDDLRREGTLAREAEMAWHVRQALDERAPATGPVLVVVGGFHAVAFPDLLADPPSRPEIAVGDVVTGEALIRYDFDRLERLNGYASGMTSPAWHQRIWDERRRGATPTQARRSAALVTLLDVAEAMRVRHRTPVATPSLAAAHQQVVLLADLRRRPAPLRSDLLDGVTSCLVQGEVDTEGALVRRVTRRVLTGDRVGRVPPGAGTPPLVADTLARVRAQRLPDDAEGRTVALDLYRNPAHRRSSRLLHGLRMLGVPYARHDAGPDFVAGTGLARLQERWACAWTPGTEGALVEAALLGSTLPEAVAAAFARLVAAATEEDRTPDSREATALLAQATVLGLHDQAAAVIGTVRSAVAAEPEFATAVAATGGLALLAEGREPLEAHRLTELPALVAAGYARALYLGRELQGEECPAEQVAESLARLRELLSSPAGEGLDPDPFWATVEVLRTGHDTALVRGAAAGLAYAAGRLPTEELARDVRGHLAGTTDPVEAVGFLRGLLATAREAMWQEAGLVPALDDRLRGWDEGTFLRHLPDLRLAFASLTPRETDRVADLVAGLHGLDDGLGPLVVRDLDEGTVARHLEVAHRARALVEGDGLGAWLAPVGEGDAS